MAFKPRKHIHWILWIPINSICCGAASTGLLQVLNNLKKTWIPIWRPSGNVLSLVVKWQINLMTGNANEEKASYWSEYKAIGNVYAPNDDSLHFVLWFYSLMINSKGFLDGDFNCVLFLLLQKKDEKLYSEYAFLISSLCYLCQRFWDVYPQFKMLEYWSTILRDVWESHFISSGVGSWSSSTDRDHWFDGANRPCRQIRTKFKIPLNLSICGSVSGKNMIRFRTGKCRGLGQISHRSNPRDSALGLTVGML